MDYEHIPRDNKRKSERMDSIIFRLIITGLMILLPYIVYYFKQSIELAEIFALCEIIFLLVSTREDVLDLKNKIEKKN
jgi:hypothetical protein